MARVPSLGTIACVCCVGALVAAPLPAGAQARGVVVLPLPTGSLSLTDDAAEGGAPARTVVTPGPAPFALLSASARSLRDSLVAFARAQVGRRYVHGGESPGSGFDCSGLLRYVMEAFRVPLPRTAALQARSGLAVAKDAGALRPGDLLTFGNGRRVTHVGIYVGDGRFVHASSVAGKVIESPLDRPPAPLIKPWRGARRVVADSTTVVAVPGATATGAARVGG